MTFDRFVRHTGRAHIVAGGVLAAVVCGFSIQAVAAPLPLKICSIDDRSGSAADTGIEGLNGLKMAIDPVNAKGGINGRKIELITYDGKTDPQLTATFATRCAEDDGGLLIIGGNPSAPAAAMVPVATQNKIPYYVLSASAVDMKGATFHFRFGPDVSQDGLAVADAFEELGFKKVAVINNSVPFGVNGAKSLVEALQKKKGIQVVSQQTYDVAATDVSPQVINVQQAAPEIIVIYPYPADGARVMRTIRQLGLKTPVIMPRVGLIQTFRDLAGPASNGVLVPNSVDPSRPDVQKFYAEYNKLYKPVQESPYAAQGYDAGNLAIKVLSTPDVQKALDSGDLAAARIAIRDGTEKVGKFSGIQGTTQGPYDFSSAKHHGPPDSKFFVFTQIAGDGKQLVVPDLNAIKPKN